MPGIPEVHCPPDGPVIDFNLRTGEKYANCIACRRCGACSRHGFIPNINFNEGENKRRYSVISGNRHHYLSEGI